MLGFDVMRWLLRVVLPISLVFVGVIVALYVTTDEPKFQVGRVFHSPDQHLTWVGFAGVVTLMAGSTLTLVTNVADFCRYTPTRRDVRIGLARLGDHRGRSSTRSSAATRRRRRARRTRSSPSPT